MSKTADANMELMEHIRDHLQPDGCRTVELYDAEQWLEGRDYDFTAWFPNVRDYDRRRTPAGYKHLPCWKHQKHSTFEVDGQTFEIMGWSYCPQECLPDWLNFPEVVGTSHMVMFIKHKENDND